MLQNDNIMMASLRGYRHSHRILFLLILELIFDKSSLSFTLPTSENCCREIIRQGPFSSSRSASQSPHLSSLKNHPHAPRCLQRCRRHSRGSRVDVVREASSISSLDLKSSLEEVTEFLDRKFPSAVPSDGNDGGVNGIILSSLELVPPHMLPDKGKDGKKNVVYQLKDLDVELLGLSEIRNAYYGPFTATSDNSSRIKIDHDQDLTNQNDYITEEGWIKDARFYINSIFPNTDSTIDTTQQNEVIIRWNITFPPPQSTWLYALADAWPGVSPVPVSYQHLSGSPTSFSWGRVGSLFGDALMMGKLRVLLACVEGRSVLRFTLNKSAGEHDSGYKGVAKCAWELARIVEETSYASDLVRGSLKNRYCAWDLRHFLESMRRPQNILIEDWEQTVLERLPWESVPRMMNSMEIEPMDEDEGMSSAIVFLGFSGVAILLFSLFIASDLLRVAF